MERSSGAAVTQSVFKCSHCTEGCSLWMKTQLVTFTGVFSVTYVWRCVHGSKGHHSRWEIKTSTLLEIYLSCFQGVRHHRGVGVGSLWRWGCPLCCSYATADGNGCCCTADTATVALSNRPRDSRGLRDGCTVRQSPTCGTGHPDLQESSSDVNG